MNPMHRRLSGWNYRSRCNYMATLVTEPRAPVFGKVEEWGVRRSDDARAIYDAWQAISSRFPVVQASYYVIMPDHFHGILYFRETAEYDLDEVVGWFKAEVERRLGRKIWAEGYQDSVCLHVGQLHRMISYILSNPKRAWIKAANPRLFRKYWRLAHPRLPALGGEEGDNWLEATGDDGETARLPRKGNRLALPFGTESTQQKEETGSTRQKAGAVGFLSCAFCPIPGWRLAKPGFWQADPGTLPDYCTETTLQTATVWAALGNLFLLERPMLVAIRLSRSTPPEELKRLVDKAVAYASRGAILASPFFSPPEQAVKQAAIEAGGSVIQLVPSGFSPLAKPSGRDFDLCSEGRLLQLSAFPYEPGRGSLSKTKCEWMNSAAMAIADTFLGWPNIDRKQGDQR